MSIDLSVSNLINIFFIAAGIGICSLSILHVGSGMHIRKEVKKYFQIFFTLINIYISMHFIRMLLENHTGTAVSISIRAVTFIEFFVSGLMIYMLSLLILFIAAPGKNGKLINIIFLVLITVHTLGLLIDQFTDFYYYFDEMNVYHRSRGYAMSNIMHILMLIQNVFLLIRYRNKINKKLASALWLYLLSPLAAIALQLGFQQIQFVILATVISAAYLYFVIIRIQTEKYENQQKEKDRLDTELSMATRIQAETLPNIFPAFPERDDFNIFASMNPAKEVGGDFYDFFLLDDTHLGIVMADVSGKGVPAALFMMVSKILIQNIAMMGNRPADVLKYVNNQLCTNNHEEMFVTVWYGCLDLETGILEAANAGHEYPVLKKAAGSFEMIKDKHGIVLGAMEGSKYRSYELQMEPGAKLFIYTDGVPEATNSANELFGTERLVHSLRMKETGSPKEIINHIDSIVKDFVKDAPQFDDLTMLCLEYKGHID
ncbi:PP2C family protein-serine/threonine phosphatase [Butyrivibrio sp. AE2032]|uniref:PP2C family protein-serine/threonine phosphatase n=1 Tax=Butyrivibrio sp. AE2032 TaxID=1458463 RepID=UPI00068931C6|nr:PP2C family protein-serine/threonine phosphatase [Butyrivibrio sp. AE2032]